VTATQLAWRAAVLATVTFACTAQGEAFDASKLREHCPGFAEWDNQLPTSAARGAPTRAQDPALKAKILRMSDEDQTARQPMTTAGVQVTREQISNMHAVDLRHLKAIKAIVARYGTPTSGLIGEDGVHAFWILIQHADTDPKLQEKVLQGFRDRPDGIRLDDIAMLSDRVRANQHRPQIYGNHFHSEGKELVQTETEDPDHLDERRRGMNLPPMAVYKCMLHVMYGDPVR
jgi:uncharacterized protein DUF6624